MTGTIDSGEFPKPTGEPVEQHLQADDVFTSPVPSTPAVPATPVEAPKDIPVDPPKETPAPKAKADEGVLFAPMPTLEFETDPHNVTLTKPTTSPGSGHFFESLDLPSASQGTQEKLMATFPNLKDMKNKDDVRWGQTFMQSMQMVPANGAIDGSLSREGSDWRQGVEINGDVIRSAIPRFKQPNNSVLAGEQAMQMSFTHMGLGDFFHAAMWNSGFWITFKPAPEVVWLNINRILGQDVSGISRQTYGMLHSAATSLAVSTIINSLLPYVYATSVNNNELAIADIPKYLSNHDEHDFIWGFISANYPQGVTIERSCIVDPNVCRETISERLEIPELQVVDNTILPEVNKIHMRSRGHGSMSLKSVLEYQERLLSASDSVITLKGSNGKEAKLTLSVPTSDKKSRMSNAYVAEIQEAILATVTADIPMSQREPLYEEQMTATELRLYQHWVKKIELSDDRNNIIEDETAIASTLGGWTRDPVLRQQFFDEMGNFINRSNISAIGMEPAKCPKCGGDHNRPSQRVRGKIDYIPLDMIQVFSYLAEYKTRLILARA